jgi:hypothetical protein
VKETENTKEISLVSGLATKSSKDMFKFFTVAV